MKKNNFILFALFAINTSAQVGINTQNPQGIFNIDGAKDNNTTGTPTATQQQNDFTVLANGNVGIGTTEPTQKIEINTGGTSTTPITGFKLVDGNQKKNYSLMSDDDGVGTWKPITMEGINGTFVAPTTSTTTYYFATNENNYINTGSYITLPPGKWKIDLNLLLRPEYTNNQMLTATDYIWIRFTFTDSSASTTPLAGTDFESGVVEFVSGTYSGPTIFGVLKYGMVNGTVIIKNNTTSNKTYYLLAGNSLASNNYRTSDINGTTKLGTYYFRSLGSNAWRENRMVAIPLSED